MLNIECKTYEIDGFGECVLLSDACEIIGSIWLTRKYLNKGLLTKLEIPPKYRKEGNFGSRDLMIPISEIEKIYTGGIRHERPAKRDGQIQD